MDVVCRLLSLSDGRIPALDGVGGRSALAGNRISGSEDVLILASSINPDMALAFGGDF